MAKNARERARSIEEIRLVVKSAQSQSESDPEMRTLALRNPIGYLCNEPYNLTVKELSAAYDDTTLNIAHPDHRSYSKAMTSIGCILCG